MAGPKYPQTLRSGNVALSTANTNRDGSGTLGTLITGVANGTKVTKVDIAATGTTTDGWIRFFLYDGTNHRFIDEIRVPANTPSGAIGAWRSVWYPPGGEINLPSTSHVLKASTEKNETFHAVAEGWDY